MFLYRDGRGRALHYELVLLILKCVIMLAEMGTGMLRTNTSLVMLKRAFSLTEHMLFLSSIW